jgi:hypothetical protein
MIIDYNKIHIDTTHIGKYANGHILFHFPKEYSKEVLIASMENEKLLILFQDDHAILANKYTHVDTRVDEDIYLSDDWRFISNKEELRNEKLKLLGL